VSISNISGEELDFTLVESSKSFGSSLTHLWVQDTIVQHQWAGRSKVSNSPHCIHFCRTCTFNAHSCFRFCHWKANTYTNHNTLHWNRGKKLQFLK